MLAACGCVWQVPACMVTHPAACRHSITNTTRGLPPPRKAGRGEAQARGGVIPGEQDAWQQMSEGAACDGDPWRQLVHGVETKARRRRATGARSVPLLGGEAESKAQVLAQFVDYYGIGAMAAVEKKLVTEWGGGGFSPRFLRGKVRRNALA